MKNWQCSEKNEIKITRKKKKKIDKGEGDTLVILKEVM
jgi:hypothetical protein